MVVAQFWSFANDLYTPDQGKRLFAIVGFGGSLGAMAGSSITSVLIARLGEFKMMLISAGILLICLALTNLIHAREKQRAPDASGQLQAEQPLGRDGGFQLVLRQRYLLLIGMLTLAVQFVNTNGNYILGETLTQMARTAVAGGASGGLSNEAGGDEFGLRLHRSGRAAIPVAAEGRGGDVEHEAAHQESRRVSFVSEVSIGDDDFV